MVKTRLTERERQYYDRLMNEDNGFYTVVDTVRQLPMFEGRFSDEDRALAFIEFLSNIFHICWQADVYRTNHLRLIDILFGMQYAIEFNRDKEAEADVALIIERFEQIYEPASERIPPRVFAAGRDLIDGYEENIPGRRQIREQVERIIKLHPLYAVLYLEQLQTAGSDALPEWSLADRNGIYLNPRTAEPAGMDPVKRRKALRDWLEQQ